MKKNSVEISFRESGALLLVVAHPDDESLWCGGSLALLGDAGVPIVIVCLTNAANPIRAAEFNRACGALKAKGLMFDFRDGGAIPLPSLDKHLDNVMADIPMKIVCVLTHSPTGEEHGHLQHRQSHRQVKAWAKKRALPFGTFSDCSLMSGVGDRVVGGTVQVFRMFPQLPGTLPILLDRIFLAFRNRRNFMQILRGDLGQLFLTARALLVVPISLERKHELCSLYASQLAGLRSYQMYDSAVEYIYLDDMQLGLRLATFLEAAINGIYSQAAL